MATKKTTKIDEIAEAKINAAYAKAAGVTSALDDPRFKNFGKTPAKKKATPAKKSTAKKK